MNRPLLVAVAMSLLGSGITPASDEAELIIHNAKVVTLDAKSSIAEAVAAREGKIVAVGTNAEVLKRRGEKTRVFDARGKLVLPGLHDSHVHPSSAALSEVGEPVPNLRSILEILNYIKERAKALPERTWIVIRYAFPTRLKEARFPTKAELDQAAPKHPVLYHAGPAGIANSMALKISGVTKDTEDPAPGQIVKDPVTGEPTGMLRNAYGVLRGLPAAGEAVSREKKRVAVRKLFALYNREGITSISDRNGSRDDLDLYLALAKAKELTVRVNVARSFNSSGSREEIARQFDDLRGKDGRGGPTGTGDDWVRIGPIKLFLDGGMLNGSAYMRKPWPRGATYQIAEDNYRGLLFIKPEQLRVICEEGARRKWSITAHCAGEGAMDVLLNAYEFTDRIVPIRDLRFCITHANFPSAFNLERCKKLGVCADVQPAWLYKDSRTLLKVLGPERMRWFQPYKSWLAHTTIGGGSDHMLRYDPLDSTNPWSPWLGLWVAVARQYEGGGVLEPDEALSREEALRLYTTNNAYLAHEEELKGTLEVGKLADLIIIDRDVLTCPVADIQETKVLLIVVGGKVVFERK